MYSEAKHTGDHGSVGEEMLANIPLLEERARMVEKAVKDRYFRIDQALSLYKISEIEYFVYLFLKNRNKLGTLDKQLQLVEVLSVIGQLFHAASSKFDPKGKKIMAQLETLSSKSSLMKV